MNLKIKPTQSFGGAHRGRVCVCVFIGMSARTCMSIYVCTVFLKKKKDSAKEPRNGLHYSQALALLAS
jgi:hypothetical protein